MDDEKTITHSTPWLTTAEAMARLRIKSPKTIYEAVKLGKLRAARISSRRSLRFRAEWCDQYLEATAEPVEVKP